MWPESADEVRASLELARAHGVCLIPYGGGTNVTDALRCPADERRTIVSLDLRRMNRVLWIDPENRTAGIEAGATRRRDRGAARAATASRSATSPTAIEFSTLGGWIATNASGMKKNRYGNIEDIVLAISAVTPSGELARAAAPRESVGADPARWLFGSEGELGIVTSAVVKIFPLPEVQRYGSMLFHDFETGVAFLRDVQRAGDVPASVRLMDNLQFQFGQALKPRAPGSRRGRARSRSSSCTRVQGLRRRAHGRLHAALRGQRGARSRRRSARLPDSRRARRHEGRRPRTASAATSSPSRSPTSATS